ncbi:MFS transporter [Amycolatopsis balhimycina]|uniref:MFS transporter n=1 Tax=Amycolatopsis balhimycina TaxID=208443 RepID=UPI00036972D3|nr:MFS transporter [Amycolatopsis balhimycina]
MSLPAFRRYFAARTISLAGDAMLPVALTVAVLHEGYGATGVGLVLAAPLVPWVALMLFSGVLADRIGPLPMMLGADLLRFLGQGVLASALLLGHASLTLLVVMQVLSGIGTGFFQPGVGSIVPEITDDTQAAIGLLRAAEAAVATLAPALAGVALTLLDPGVVVGLDAASFAVSGALLLFLRLPSRKRVERKDGRHLRSDLVVGWREFRARRWLWTVIVTFGLFGLLVFGPFYVLSAATITAHHGSQTYGVVVALQGGGAVVGGLVGSRIRPRRPLLMAVCALFLTVPQILALAANGPIPLLAGTICLGAVGRSVWSVLWSSTEQRHVPKAVLNRIYAYDVVGSIALLPVGRAVAGPLAAIVGDTDVLLLSAATALLGCTAMLATRQIRTLPTAPAPLLGGTGGAARAPAPGHDGEPAESLEP